MKGYRRHRILFGIFRFLFGWFIRLKFNFKYDRIDSDTPFMLVTNHNSNWDPLMLGIASKKHMYFVASEHVYRAGFWSVLLKWALSPIARMKGGTDANSAMAIIRTMRKGANVCLFAEGNRSFNGLTYPIFPATGKLIRSTGAKLITYKFIGGYFSDPRWSKKMRRGRMEGRIINEYSPEQLRKLSGEEINELLRRDLHEDAYETQKQNPVAYKGKDLAEHIQTALYICPKCRGLDTIKSKGNEFWCEKCSTRAAYTEYGDIVGDFGYDTVTAWDMWQQNQLEQTAKTISEQKPIIDENMEIRVLKERHGSRLVTQGRLYLYSEKLCCGSFEVKIDDIADIDMVSRSTLLFTTRTNHYEIKSKQVYCARKYIAFINILKSSIRESAG